MRKHPTFTKVIRDENRGLDCLDNYPQQSKVKKHHALKSTINSTFVPICFVAEVGIFFVGADKKKIATNT